MELLATGTKKLLEGTIGLIFNLALIIALITIFIFAIKYITGSSKGAEEVHKRIFPFLLGIGLAFLAFTIINLIRKFF